MSMHEINNLINEELPADERSELPTIEVEELPHHVDDEAMEAAAEHIASEANYAKAVRPIKPTDIDYGLLTGEEQFTAVCHTLSFLRDALLAMEMQKNIEAKYEAKRLQLDKLKEQNESMVEQLAEYEDQLANGQEQLAQAEARFSQLESTLEKLSNEVAEASSFASEGYGEIDVHELDTDND